ncbi:hypothetical protein O3P69_011500 [Scylla paramamosain]|uniref:MD-2-related lipid-recognition domain-containing protein n=1 Tax=Scylla paramamosain TaxID=85552 RepID=A0AAW0T7S8_SCYPA
MDAEASQDSRLARRNVPGRNTTPTQTQMVGVNTAVEKADVESPTINSHDISAAQPSTLSTHTMALCLLLLAAALAFTAATNVEDCGSTATISNLIITGCDVPPCHFQRGTNITVDIDLKNNEATSKLTTKVTATLAGVEVPWTGADPNACDNLTKGSCPLEAGEESHYKGLSSCP